MSGAALAPALAEALAALPARLSPERVDRVWIFPPRAVGASESHLVVLSLFDADDPVARREIFTLHCSATLSAGRWRHGDEWVAQGSAPVERVERLIDGVLLRLKDDREIPRGESIGGDAARWRSLCGLEAPST